MALLSMVLATQTPCEMPEGDGIDLPPPEGRVVGKTSSGYHGMVVAQAYARPMDAYSRRSIGILGPIVAI